MLLIYNWKEIYMIEFSYCFYLYVGILIWFENLGFIVVISGMWYIFCIGFMNIIKYCICYVV